MILSRAGQRRGSRPERRRSRSCHLLRGVRRFRASAWNRGGRWTNNRPFVWHRRICRVNRERRHRCLCRTSDIGRRTRAHDAVASRVSPPRVPMPEQPRTGDRRATDGDRCDQLCGRRRQPPPSDLGRQPNRHDGGSSHEAQEEEPPCDSGHPVGRSHTNNVHRAYGARKSKCSSPGW